jgi:hypothetical protein
MMVERQRDLGAVGQVGRDVLAGQLDLAVLHVLGVDEQDVVQETQLLEEAAQTRPSKSLRVTRR